jgi:hypothetical protein
MNNDLERVNGPHFCEPIVRFIDVFQAIPC